MKDKLVSMAPFFVILALVGGWGFAQGWFSPSPVPQEEAIAESVAPAQEVKSDVTAPTPVETPPAETPVVAPDPVAPTPAPAANNEPGVTRWSTYHGDEQLAGVADVALPEKLVRRWRFQASNGVYHAPVASEKLLHFVTDKGEVFGVDFKGVKVWSKQLTRLSPVDNEVRDARVDGPAACFRETLFVGTMAGVVHALDAATGEEKWNRDIDSTILGSITMQPATDSQPDRLYIIGQDDGALHCLTLADGTPLWKSEPIDRCDGSPASGEGVLAFGSCASALHVISADDGVILQNISLGDEDQVAGGVAIRGNSIFSGSHSGKLFHADGAAGTILWTNTDAEDEVFTTPAVSADTVIFGSMDDIIYALDRATGKQRWNVETRGLVMSPVIARDKVLVSAGGVLSILSLDSGTELWSFEVSDEISSPSIIDGMIIVGSDDGAVSAFGAA